MSGEKTVEVLSAGRHDTGGSIRVTLVLTYLKHRPIVHAELTTSQALRLAAELVRLAQSDVIAGRAS